MPGYAVYLDVRPEVEEPLWRALSDAAAPATVHELHLATAAHPNAIQHRLSRWVSAGLVTRTEGSPRRFAMTDTTERTPRPRASTLPAASPCAAAPRARRCGARCASCRVTAASTCRRCR